MNVGRGPSAIWWAAIWTVASAGAALAIAPRAILHDPAFYVVCGLRIAHGQVPYRDFFDINPPLIMYLSTPPALFARALDVNPIPIFTVMLTLLSAWSALLADATFRRMRPGAQPLERLVLALVPLGPCALHVGAMDPGQREHFFILLYYPYMLARVARFHEPGAGSSLVSRRGAILRGVMASAGVCIKPYFLLPALAVEAGLLAVTKRWRALFAPEVAAACAFAAAYAAHFALLPAASRDALFHRILPLVLHGYGAYNGEVATLLTRVLRRAGLLALLALVCAWLVRGPLRIVLPAAVSFTAGGIAAVAAQQKGWGYHYMVGDTGLLLLFAIIVTAAIDRLTPLFPSFVRSARAAFAAVLMIIMMGWRPLFASRAMSDTMYAFRSVLVRYTAPGDGVVVLSTSVTFGHPAVLQTDRHFATRHFSALLWELAWFAAKNGYVPGAAEQRRFIDEVAADIRANEPAAVFIDSRDDCTTCPGETVARALKANASFTSALAAYRFRGIEDQMEVYTRR